MPDELKQWVYTVLIPLTIVMSAASVVGGILLTVFCARALCYAPAAASQSAKAVRTVQFVLLSQGIADVSSKTRTTSTPSCHLALEPVLMESPP